MVVVGIRMEVDVTDGDEISCINVIRPASKLGNNDEPYRNNLVENQTSESQRSQTL